MMTIRRPTRSWILVAAGMVGLLGFASLPAGAQDASLSPVPVASIAPVPVNPYDGAVEGSGVGKTIGYISLGESIPGVGSVSDGIREEAAKAGANLVFCDSDTDPATTLACAQEMKAQGAEGVLNFQVDPVRSPEYCAAYGNVPTIAIDLVQPPCQTVFMGANNHEAGRLAGAFIGQYARDTWSCDYTAYVSLESLAAGAANTDRMGGYRDGFTEYCPIDPATEHVLDGAEQLDPAFRQVSDLLSSLPGDRIIVVAINDYGIQGAIGAAESLGRQTDLFYAAQGADRAIWKDIACNPQLIGTTAYFPERYGRTVVPAMIDLLDGKSVPTPLYTRHEVIDRDNIREVYPQTPAC